VYLVLTSILVERDWSVVLVSAQIMNKVCRHWSSFAVYNDDDVLRLHGHDEMKRKKMKAFSVNGSF
jgi:hypothetical protein